MYQNSKYQQNDIFDQLQTASAQPQYQEEGIDLEIKQLEQWVFNPQNREQFINSLINDTESHYYYSLLYSLNNISSSTDLSQLTEQQQNQLQKFKKFKTQKSLGIQLRQLLIQYDKSSNLKQKKSIIKEINKLIFKIQFKNDPENNESNFNDIVPQQLDMNMNNEDFEYNQNYESFEQEQQYMNEDSYSSQSISPALNIPEQQQQRRRSVYSCSSGVNSDVEPVQIQALQRQQTEQQQKSALNNNEFDLQKFLNKAYEKDVEFQQLSKDAINFLDMNKLCQSSSQLSLQVFDQLIQNYNLHTLSNQEIVLFIDTYLQLQNNALQKKRTLNNQPQISEFNNSTFFSKLTINQFRYLATDSKYKDQFRKLQTFVHQWYIREFSHDNSDKNDLDIAENQKIYRENLQKKYQWALELPLKFKSLSDQLLYEILSYGIKSNHYDFDLFLEYIKNPKDLIEQSNTKFMKVQQTQRKNYNYDSQWYQVHRFDPTKWQPQSQLIDTYILKYYQTNKSSSIAPFDEYFNQTYLKRKLILAQLYNGETNIEGVSDYFTAKEIQGLSEIKKLDLCPFNKKVFRQNEEVKIYMEMQNIKKLQVKIFEIQIENYYLKTLKEFEHNLDLDGLTSTQEQWFDYSQNNDHPCKKITREFKLDSITKKNSGIFIIEFISQGISSRAIIKKGVLNLISRYTVAGQSVFIINENGEIQIPQVDKKVGIWVDKEYYKANEKDGEIIIPYAKQSQYQKQVILVSGNFATIRKVDILTDSYNLKCFYYYNEEQFLMGRKGSIIVQPRLMLHGQIAPLDIIEEGEVIIQTTTEEDIPSTTKYDKIKFSNSEDYEAQFQVPAKLKRVRVEVKAKIKRVQEKQEDIKDENTNDDENYIKLNHNHEISYTSKKNIHTFTGLYLKKSTKQDYLLYVLGKNGEGIKNISIELSLTHKFLQTLQSYKLETDEEGKVNLGQLKEVIGIQARTKVNQDINSMEKKWVIENNIYEGNLPFIPEQIKICQGESVNIDMQSTMLKDLQITKENFQLLQIDSKYQIILNDFLKNLSKNSDNTQLEIKDLQQGEYNLRIVSLKQNVRITVVPRSQRLFANQSIISNKYLYFQNDGNSNLYNSAKLTDFVHDEDKEEIRLKIQQNQSKNVRVHIFTYQQFSNNQNKPGIFEKNFYKNANSYDKSITLKPDNSVMMSNRIIAEEIAYVLDRKNAARFTGNSLEKPQILLKKNFVKNTSQKKEQLNTGKDYQQQQQYGGAMDSSFSEDEDCFGGAMDRSYSREMKPKQKKKLKCKQANKGGKKSCSSSGSILINDTFSSQLTSYDKHNPVIDNFLNFFQNTAISEFNLVPDENGEIIVKLPKDQQIYSGIQIVLSTQHNILTYVKELNQNENKFITKSLTQKTNLQSGKYYSIFRNSQTILNNSETKINDITSTEYSFIDSIGKLFDLSVELNKFYYNRSSSELLDKWEFLKKWHTYTPNEKLLKYNEFQSAELNMFIYFKDKDFYEQVIQRFILNKIEKKLIDYFLLGEYDTALELYNNIEKLSDLNVLETCLLIYILIQKGKKEEAKDFLQVYENKFKLQKTNIEQNKKLFDIALNQIDKDKKQDIAKVNQDKVQQKIQQRSLQSRERISQRVTQEISQGQNLLQCQQITNCIQPPMSQMISYNNNQNNNSNQQFYAAPQRMNRNNSGFMLNDQQDFGEFDYFADKYQNQRKQQQLSYQQLGITKEYQETHYYKNHTDSQSSMLIQLNPFWMEYARHIVDTGKLTGFLSKNILQANKNYTEQILSLAVSDINNLVPEHQQTMNEKELNLVPGYNMLLFTKEIQETNSKLRNDILITQRFFDPKEKYIQDEDDPNIKYNKDVSNFAINKIYGCQVIVTNSSISEQQLQILHEVPQGSIPVYNIEYTKTQLHFLSSYSTKVIEYYFYFPIEGEYSMYPANVARQGQVCAVANDLEVKVLKEIKVEKLDTIEQILSKGSEEDILNFIENKNIWNNKIFDFSDIYHLLEKESFYIKLVKILKKRKVYDHFIFQHSIYHGHHDSLIDFLNHSKQKQKLNQYIQYQNSSLLKINRTLSNNALNFKLLEYHPIVNARVHLLKTDQANIQNEDLQKQYTNLLRYLAEKPSYDFQDKLVLVYYLLVQERIDEALKIFESISCVDSGIGQLQYDYISAYLNFYNGSPNFTIARGIIEKYLDYPVISWRNLFYEMANQLGEYDGEQMEDDDLLKELNNKNKSKSNDQGADKETLLEVKIEGKNILIEHKNVNQKYFKVNFYVVDLEVFFSKKPFLSSIYEDFSYLKPSETIQIEVNELNQDGLNITKADVIDKLQNTNVFVQVQTDQKSAGGIYFSTSLKVQLYENYGQLKITDSKEKPISKIYVKAFSKTKNGKIEFHKDGYTDLRGKFDYLSLNSDSKNNYEKFSLFIMSDTLGCVIKEAGVPAQLAKQSQTVELRAHGWQQQHKTKLNKRSKNQFY